jgi:hypothetical protein
MAPYVPPERLFRALDGRDLTVAGGRFRIRVFSIADLSNARWVQLALDGGARCMLTLKLSAGDGVSQVLNAVASWVGNPSRFGDGLTAA